MNNAGYRTPIGIAFAVSVNGITCLHKHTTPPSPTFSFSRDKAEKCPTHSRFGLPDHFASTFSIAPVISAESGFTAGSNR